jgi:peptidyl-Asp metalloendopeptidase
MNFALASSGGVASASSQYSAGYPVSAVNDGDRKGISWGRGGGWNDATVSVYPDWLQVDFSGSQAIDEIDVFTLQDNYPNPVAPALTDTFTQYGITNFDIQYWNGLTWTTVPNGNITNNNKVWKQVTFTPVVTTAIRIQVNASLSSYSRVVEVEAWGGGSGPGPTPTPTPTPLPGGGTNVALASNGGIASASSEYSAGYPVSSVNDGDRKGINWGSGGGWNDATANVYPDWLEVDFNATKTINEIDVFTLQDNYPNPVDPTLTDTFAQYGITNFDIQYWNGSAWITAPNGSIVNNNKVWTRLTFPAVQTTGVRVVVNASSASYSRIVEVEAVESN